MHLFVLLLAFGDPGDLALTVLLGFQGEGFIRSYGRIFCSFFSLRFKKFLVFLKFI